MSIRKKQRGAAAIEYAILAAAMSVVLLTFVGGSEGKLTQAIVGAYNTVIDSLEQTKDSGN
ncbi:Flp family type IVb pilin [Vibrio ostreicida]|uniref:Flp family type IVb pilin n=1 Tax=Vibrio ostreicida TaxID=526588 RepID=A0ABT8C1R0_9VIBR|nr:Flp family type IVb pilin [Vibrio ostreicida]MDN3612277.1 Flp family type IVb pilin [Vibrio ostreicida]NPD08660.1 Flp family type IVb pilin [Vibrio ostreicida]